MKFGKIEESELFTDHFKHIPHRLFVILTCLFNSMIVHGIAPINLLPVTMTRIIKDNRESPNNSNNYRTLTIGTCLSKVFDLLILRNKIKYLIHQNCNLDSKINLRQQCALLWYNIQFLTMSQMVAM